MGLLDEMKEVGDLIKKAGDIDLYRRIVRLEGEVTELTREKRRLEEKVDALERALKFNEELKFKAPFYWLDGDPVGYCASCWESKRLAVHVTDGWDPVHFNHKVCPTCKHPYVGRPGV